MLLATMGMPLSGCVIRIGTGSEASSGSESSPGSESNSGTPTGPADPLPEPSVSRVDLPVLTPDQQKRKDEVDQFLALQYQAQGWHIVDTTQTFLGDILLRSIGAIAMASQCRQLQRGKQCMLHQHQSLHWSAAVGSVVLPGGTGRRRAGRGLPLTPMPSVSAIMAGALETSLLAHGEDPFDARSRDDDLQSMRARLGLPIRAL